MRKRADCAADLSDSDRFASTQQALTITPHLVEPERERQTKRRRLRVNSMRAPDLRCVLELERATLQHLDQLVDFLQQNLGSITQQQRIRSIDDVR
jgi:hypothetical protein